MTSSDTPDPLRDLLTRVAAGEVDPEQAARLLDAEPEPPTVDRVDLVPASPSATGPSVVIHAGGVKLIVVADPTVATAVAEGPHSIRHDGDTLVIDVPSGDGYQTQDAPRFLGWVPTTWTGGRGERVTVRLNPDLPLTIEATASSVEVSGLRAGLTLSTQASSVKVREHRGAVHGSASMSNVSIKGAITEPSVFTSEFGNVNLRLDAGSDVVVSAVSEMGSLKVSDADVTQEDGGMRSRATVGTGSHVFDLTVRMGSASVVLA